MRRKGRAKALYISYYGNLQVFSLDCIPLCLHKMLPKKYKRYKRKYLGWLQGENRKLHKIFGDKNLTESVHRKISHDVQNCLSLSPAIVHLLDFACYAKFSHSHEKMLVVGFLPLVFFLTSLIDLAKGYEVLQSFRFFMYWSFNLHCHGYTKFSLILGWFQWSNSYQKHQNLPKTD